MKKSKSEYICSNCKTALSSYRRKCPECGARNVNYNKYILAVVLYILVGMIVIPLYQINLPGMFTDSEILIMCTIYLIFIIRYPFTAGSCFKKDLIIEKGNQLLNEHSSFTLDDFSIACGRRVSDSKEYIEFRKLVFEVAKTEGWVVNDERFTRTVSQADEPKI